MITKKCIEHNTGEEVNRLILEDLPTEQVVISIREGVDLNRFWLNRNEVEAVRYWLDKFLACSTHTYTILGDSPLCDWCKIVIISDGTSKKVELRSVIHNTTHTIPWSYKATESQDNDILNDPQLVSRAIELFGTSIFK